MLMGYIRLHLIKTLGSNEGHERHCDFVALGLQISLDYGFLILEGYK